MRIAVIGGAGRMGRWLTRHLIALGHSIVVSDPLCPERNAPCISERASVASSNVYAVSDADLVVISVPMDKTVEVIREVVRHMKESAILCEVSSVKGDTPEVLMGCLPYGVRPLSIHPMFGPGSHAQTTKVILLPIVNPETELQMVSALFPDSEVIIAEAEEHDRAMALTLSLPYLVNMVLASVLVEEDLSFLQSLGGTTFAVQLLLTSSVMSNAPRLHRALHTMNEHSLSVLRKFESLLHDSLATLVGDPDEFEESYQVVQESLAEWVNLDEKYREMYQLLEMMDCISREDVKFP